MKKLKLVVLVDRIEKLQDENHRLMTENDLLRNEMAEAKNRIKKVA